MPQALDTATGQVTDVPDADFHEQWKAGKVAPIAGARYSVQLGNGQYGSVPSEGLATALQGGARLVSPEAAQAALLDRKYGGVEGAAEAGVGGFAQQATLGGSDELLRAFAPGALEAEQQASSRHPIASMIGQGLGAAALTSVTGLGGAAEGLGARAAAGVGLGESVAGRIAARGAVMGLRGVAEGAQMGVAQAISDDAISNHKETAEQVLSTLGGNMLWGGAIGGGLGLLGGGIGEVSAARQRAASLDKALQGAATEADVKSVAGKALGVDPAPGLGDKVRGWYSKIASAVSGGDAAAIDQFTEGAMKPGTPGYEARRALLEAEETRNAASREVREHVDNIIKANEAVTEEAKGALKKGYVDSAVEGVDRDVAAQKTRDLVDHARGTLGEMTADAETYGNQRHLRNALKLADEAAEATGEADAHPGDLFSTLDQLKRQVGTYTRAADQAARRMGPDAFVNRQAQASAERLKDLYETLRTGLEDESVWKQAATNQKAINAAWSEQIAKQRQFAKAFTTVTDEGPWGAKVYGVDPAKADSYVKNLLDPSKDLVHKQVTDYVRATKRLSDAISSQYDLPAAKRAAVKQLGDAADGFGSVLDKHAKQLSLVNQFEELRHMTTGHASGWLAMAGAHAHGMAGGLSGMALGKVGGLFTRPADAIMHLANVERMARESDGKIGQALRGLMRGGKAEAGTPITAYARKSAQVRDLVQNPSRIADRMMGGTSKLRETAPKLADAMTSTSLSGLAILRDRLPPERPKDPFNPSAKPIPPSPAEQAKWLRTYDAVVDPLGAVSKLASGQIAPEAKDVLKTVYPQLFSKAQTMAVQHITEGKMAGADTQKRLRLGLMLDLPIPQLEAGYIAARQAAYAAPPPDAPQAPGPGGKTGRAKINLGKGVLPALQSPADRVELGGLGD